MSEHDSGHGNWDGERAHAKKNGNLPPTYSYAWITYNPWSHRTQYAAKEGWIWSKTILKWLESHGSGTWGMAAVGSTYDGSHGVGTSTIMVSVWRNIITKKPSATASTQSNIHFTVGVREHRGSNTFMSINYCRGSLIFPLRNLSKEFVYAFPTCPSIRKWLKT